MVVFMVEAICRIFSLALCAADRIKLGASIFSRIGGQGLEIGAVGIFSRS